MAFSTAAVIPARDEAATLAETLRALNEIANLYHLIVVDDHSVDSTASIASRFGAEVLSSPANVTGKGQALRLGLLRALERGPEALLLADADLGTSASRLATLIDAIDIHHPAAIAAFPPAASGGFGLVKTLSRRAILSRTGYAPLEPLSGQRALLLSALEALERGIAPGFGAEVGMTIDLLSAGIRPREIPLPLTHRQSGRNLPGFAHRARQGLDIARALGGARIPW